MMGCSCAESYDEDTNRYQCAVSGCDCVFLVPNSKRCGEMYGEGPDADLYHQITSNPVIERG